MSIKKNLILRLDSFVFRSTMIHITILMTVKPMKEDRQNKKQNKHSKNNDYRQYDDELFRKQKTTKDFKRKKQSLLEDDDSWEDDLPDYYKK